MSETIKYSKPFLSNVIVRIDYASPIANLGFKLPKDLSRSALKIFPILEPQEVISPGLLLSAEVRKEEPTALRQWEFYDKYKQKRLSIGIEHMFISYSKYESFEQLKEQFLPIAELLFELYDELQVKRFGLRYINNIIVAEDALTDWTQYLHENLLSIFKIPKPGDTIARAFNDLQLTYDDVNLRFQYGMHNPDFPAPIREKRFVLDFDAYTQGLLEYDDLNTKIDIFHDKIQELFEESIKAALRDKMR